jgi:hypothetical protein
VKVKQTNTALQVVVVKIDVTKLVNP